MKYLIANGLWNCFTNKKKYKIMCDCGHLYSDKVSFLSDIAVSVCPNCSRQNSWLHSVFNRLYEQEL